jgi:uncharacterized protein
LTISLSPKLLKRDVDVSHKEMAERTTILRCTVGSEAYGLNVGISDRDEKAVCVEDYEAFVTLGRGFEDEEIRTAKERTGNQYAPSEPGDLDLTIYSLRKFLQLALGGNPNITELFFIQDPIKRTPLGAELQALYPYIVSKKCAGAYLGYMQKQRNDMLVKGRRHLIEMYGYDVKAASHLVRLGFQGAEILETGKISLPMGPFAKKTCLAIKQGEWKLEDVQALTAGLEYRIKDLREKDSIRDTPDTKTVEEWMQDTYWQEWSYRGLLAKAMQVLEPEMIQ